jgi:hypothetical protein
LSNNSTEKTENNCDIFIFGFWAETESICYSDTKECYSGVTYKCNQNGQVTEELVVEWPREG